MNNGTSFNANEVFMTLPKAEVQDPLSWLEQALNEYRRGERGLPSYIELQALVDANQSAEHGGNSAAFMTH